MKPNSLVARWLGCAVLAASSLSFVAPAFAVDTVLLEGGVSDIAKDVHRAGAAARWTLADKLLRTGDWSLRGYLEFGISDWDGPKGSTGTGNLVDFGLTPVVRWEMDPKRGFAPFVEGGVGVHLQTETGIAGRNFDIPFDFGSFLGGGVRFGDNGRFELDYRYQHLSNAGLGKTNPGINFHVIQLGYHF